MIEAVKFWNEPNNLSHWDFQMDPGWKKYSEMTCLAAEAVNSIAPNLTRVLGGISPIDPHFIQLMKDSGVLQYMDAVAIHGFPLDWNHWTIYEWPDKVDEIKDVCSLPVWITEVGVSTFGADEIQVFGLQKTAELLFNKVERIYWYSLMDLPPAWPATTRHKEAEGSSYYRHFYMGIIRADGTPKPSFEVFPLHMGICQWIHFEDHRLDDIVNWLNKIGVKKLRTGISWGDWYRPNALQWFDRQMKAIENFDTTITLCFTPPSIGERPDHTSPPIDLAAFASFAVEVVNRYYVQDSSSLYSGRNRDDMVLPDSPRES